jgi:cell division protease FtsH
VTMHNFDLARDKIMMGKELKSITLSKEDIRNTAIHEAGHALVIVYNRETADPLYKVTIIPRGKALGVTHAIPDHEKHTRTKIELLTDIMICLGGRVAEEVIFGPDAISTGAYSDLRQATLIARRMVGSYGMSDLGFVMYDSDDYQTRVSSQTAALVDAEVKKIIEECYAQVLEFMKKNANNLEKLAQNLIERETLSGSEVYELLGIEGRDDEQARVKMIVSGD